MKLQLFIITLLCIYVYSHVKVRNEVKLWSYIPDIGERGIVYCNCLCMMCEEYASQFTSGLCSPLGMSLYIYYGLLIHCV